MEDFFLSKNTLSSHVGDEDDEPEPENEENLLVHNVQREKAHGVKFLRETFYHRSIRFLNLRHLRQLVRWNCE